jgi:hypothetical protein
MTWHDRIAIPSPFLKGFAVFLFCLSIMAFGIVDQDWVYLVFGVALSVGAWQLARSRQPRSPAA